MITQKQQLLTMFEELQKTLATQVDIYVIGGAALLFQDLKEATKDIDLVVSTQKEFLELKETLTKLGFKTTKPTAVYKNMNVSEIYVRDDYRIDVFENEVCAKFKLSKHMKQRSATIYEQENLVVHICSNEDILLFKSMTEREGDIDDCVNITKTNLNWAVVLDELQFQAEIGEDVWITWVGERIELLSERGVHIPILDDIHELVEEYYLDLERRLKNKRLM